LFLFPPARHEISTLARNRADRSALSAMAAKISC
jgi:hypothetical protein